MAKDKAYGGIIFLVSILILLGYSYWAIILPIFPGLLTTWIPFLTAENSIWAIRIPVYIAVLVILLIAAWIGWTMATTPAPAPIDAEDFEEEFEMEETEKTEE